MTLTVYRKRRKLIITKMVYNNHRVNTGTGGSVVYWLGRRTCDSMVVSSIPGRRAIGRLVLPVLGWVAVFGRAYHLGM